MGEVAVPDQIVLPFSGEVVLYDDVEACVRSLAEIRDLEAELASVKRMLSAAIIHHASVAGKKTLDLEAGKVSVKGGSQTVYDAEKIEAGLRRAGMAEDRIREIVKETVSYSVNAVEAKRAAGANPKYERVVSRHSRVVEGSPYVSVSA